MPLQAHTEMSLLTQCVIFCFWIYSVLTFLFTSSFLSYIVLLGPIVLYGLVKYYSLPKPDASVVDEILGVNPLYDLRNKKENEVTSGNIKSWISEFDDHRNPSSSTVQSIGHRAYGLDAPENSLIAIKTCQVKGCKNIEIDVMLTKDNVPITYHDCDLSRITGKPQNVLDQTWNEIKDLDISVNHPLSEKFKDEKIPKFEDAVSLALSLNMTIYLDVKECKPEIVDAVIQLYRKFPELHTRSIVCGFNPLLTYLIRRQDPKIVCAITWRPFFYSCSSYDPYYRVTSFGEQRHKNFFRHLGAVISDHLYDWVLYNICPQLVGAVAILLAKDYVSPHEITQWERKGLRVIAWTVNLPVEKMHYARVLGVSYITDTVVGDAHP
ncbi:glycerophosphodiester phosphodiesterase 1 [Bemisia tabaci]|uniref:glycerophosphodiester phosphodiesterase 1 n=1 Tax=Bemisia tabaci TaxID=7038 RepID=UPI003B27C030